MANGNKVKTIQGYPNAKTLADSESVLFCSFCHKTGKIIDYASPTKTIAYLATPGNIVMKSCSRCQIAFYCDQTCQMQDLQSHKKYCKALPRYLLT